MRTAYWLRVLALGLLLEYIGLWSGVALATARPHTPSAATWRWQNPLPWGTNVAQVACAPSGPCYAAGDYGMILLSHDTGSTWISLHSGTTHTLTGIACPLASLCVAIGPSGFVLRSTDAGATWAAQHLGATYLLEWVVCPNTQTCYILGHDMALCNGYGQPCPHDSANNVLFATRDGGQSWQHIAVNDPGFITSIACVSAAICWLVDSDSILSTTDGGHSWRVEYRYQPSPHVPDLDLTTVACPTAATCYAAGTNGGVWTQDGGKTWALLPAANTGHPPGFADLACPVQDRCYATGEQHGIYRLEAGHWQRITARLIGLGARITCVGIDTCYVAAFAGSILVTTDGGQTWRDYTSGPRENLKAVVCLSASVCRALGADRLLETEDGGRTWTRRANPHILLPPYGYGHGLACSTAQTCYVVGLNGKIVMTRDAGAHWYELHTPLSGTAVMLTDVSCATSAVCYGVGTGCLKAGCLGPDSRSVVLRTTNGGRSWRTVFMKRNNLLLLEAIACPTARTCYVVGSPGAIFATTNAGHAWHEQRSPVSGNDVLLTAITCPSATVCYSVGGGCAASFACPLSDDVSLVLTTRSGGRTWHQYHQRIPFKLYGAICGTPGVCISSVDLSGISCPTTRFCRAVGGGGTVLVTRDGGHTWHREVAGTANYLSGIACPSTQHCFAVGSGGTILATTSDSRGCAQDRLYREAAPAAAGNAPTVERPNHGYLCFEKGTWCS